MIPKDKFPTTFGLITDGLTIVPVDNVNILQLVLW